VLLFVVVLLVFFWPAATMRGIFYFGDIYRIYYPQRAVYARCLRQGKLPLWTSDVLGGYPLLAEGETGALYPFNLLLYAFLPVDVALNLSILLHYLIAAIGTYLLCRLLRLGRLPAFAAGIVFLAGGFMVAHLNHISILTAAAWVPSLLAVTYRLAGEEGNSNGEEQSTRAPNRRKVRFVFLLALLLGLQFLAGHPQISLLSVLAVLGYGLAVGWAGSEVARDGATHRLSTSLRVLAWLGSAVLMGAGIAAAQLVPMWELTSHSVRAGGLDMEFFTSFSLHPFYLATLISPFIRGNPYPTTSVEMIGYVGLLPLAFAITAPFLRRDVQAKTFVGMALLSLFLALGRWNPLYLLFARVPFLNLFRVPARFLLLFCLSAAVLCGMGMEAMMKRLINADTSRRYEWIVVALAGSGIFGVLFTIIIYSASVESLIVAWRYLPLILSALTALLLVGAQKRQLRARIFGVLALALTLVDLYAFNAVYALTYNATMPRAEFSAMPRVLDYLPEEMGAPYRVYTHEEILPVLSVMRESLYPNISLLHRVSSANGYFPLLPRLYQQYVEDLTPRKLNLLGVRYFLIPQLLPVDEATEFYDLEDPYSPTLVGRIISTPPISITAVIVESFLSHSTHLETGEIVAWIVLGGDNGAEVRFPLRAGMETAEWAYERSDVREVIRHARAPVVRTWPARSGFPPEDHVGHTYRAEFHLDPPMTVTSLSIEPLIPRAFVRVERVYFRGTRSETINLRHLIGEGDHQLMCRSEDVAIYRNNDALPRAWIVHRARGAHSATDALMRIEDADFDPLREVILESPSLSLSLASEEAVEDSVEITQYTDDRVVLKVSAGADGYLCLADAYYPGWVALVDGQGTPILRANGMFRAIPISRGEHLIQFVYRSLSFYLGAVVSVLTCSVVLCLLYVSHRPKRA